MATQETTELRDLDESALARELEDAHRALFNLRFQAGTRQLADVSQVRKARLRVSRIKTLQREHALVSAYEAQLAGATVPAAAAAPAAVPPAAVAEPAAEPAAGEGE